jgi:hypothetical protein
MRLVALVLTLTVTGPSVASLVCDLACAVKQQAVTTSSSGCHEHGTDASTPMMARGPQCHDVSTTPQSVLTSAQQTTCIVAAADGALSTQLFRSTARSALHFHSPPHAPPPLLIPLRI